MRPFTVIRCLGIIGLLGLNLAMNPAPASLLLPTAHTQDISSTIPSLDVFAATLKNGRPQQIVGVYVANLLALRVVQQPQNDPAFVSNGRGEATQFGMAAQYGTVGLLAHNNLSGGLFFSLGIGQEVDVIYGDGSLARYSILALRHLQALRPLDPASDYIDLDDLSGTRISNDSLFQNIYAEGNRVVFQTCILAHGDPSWGRLFVIATPIAAVDPGAQAVQSPAATTPSTLSTWAGALLRIIHFR